MDKRFLIQMDEADHRRLKAMAAIRGLTIGNLIQGLVKFANAGKYYPEAEQNRFNGLLETCFLNTGTQSKDRVARTQAAQAFNQGGLQ